MLRAMGEPLLDQRLCFVCFQTRENAQVSHLRIHLEQDLSCVDESRPAEQSCLIHRQAADFSECSVTKGKVGHRILKWVAGQLAPGICHELLPGLFIGWFQGPIDQSEAAAPK